MSDERYRDRTPYSGNRDQWADRPFGQSGREQWDQRQTDRMRQQGDDHIGDPRLATFGGLSHDTPYRAERPSDDFSNRNARRDYDPYAANAPRGAYDDRGFGRSYDQSYARDDRRGFMSRAGDEVASWFGDEDAQARRDADHRGKGPRGYTRSDARILDDVSDRLADDRWVDASDVEVQVSEAEVTLTGTVRSREQKRRAEDCAEMVSGVKHVQNNLRVSERDATIL